ncbi:MAG: hypothetical protein HZA49_00880, partial [Planctomycetes bacterium]|nr:hypothetical protein [Planctomycetota bacterium]
ALQPDGKIVAAGYFYNGADIDIALVRYDVNGSLDTTFDTDGVVTTTISSGGSDYAYAIALQPDGKILIAGLSDTTGNYSFTIVRYNTNGSLDTAFDTDGVVTTTIGSSNAESYTMALQPDGKIVIAGYSYSGVSDIFTLARYNTNGALDTTFDTDGIVTTTIGILSYARAIAVQADGKIVVAGYAYNGLYDDSTLARYNTNGTLDTGFDTDGIITTTIGSSYSYAKAVAVQADGKIVAAGYAENGVNAGFAVARYWR